MAQTAFAKIKGAKQGDMSAGCSTPESIGTLNNPDHKDEITVIESDFNLVVPTDPTSGQVSGQRVYKPFVFTKLHDKSSPLLFTAVATGEQITEAVFSFTRTSTSGQQEVYFVMTLKEAVITKVDMLQPDATNPATASLPTVEMVSMTFRDITVEHKIASTQASDSYGKAA